jgi:3-methylcrotonyl-CoA carboxylase alpha subunit
MSGAWRVNGEPLQVGARVDAQRDDGFVVTVGDRALAVSGRLAPDGSLMLTMPDGKRVIARVSRDPSQAGTRWVSVGSQTWIIKEAELGSSGEDEEGGLEAPMPGKVLTVDVSAGDVVEAGAVLLVVEAMKMEHAIRAPGAGTVVALHAEVGDMVSPGTPLVDFEVNE